MPLAMARPWKHPDTGVYYLRVWVPKRFRALVGRDVVKRTLGTRDPAEARRLFREHLEDLEREWHALEAASAANLAPQPRRLTHKETVALAGEVYRRLVEAYADDPGRPAEWRLKVTADAPMLPSDLRPPGTPSPPRDPMFTPGAMAIRKYGSLINGVLAERGLEVDTASQIRLGEQVIVAIVQAHERIERLARGDYGPDPRAERFPPVEIVKAALPLEELWAAYVKHREPGPKTVKRWRPLLEKLAGFVGTQDMSTVTTTHLMSWRDALIAQGLDRATIRDAYIGSAKAVFGWAASQQKLLANPAAGVTVDVKPKPVLRSRALTDAEARTILSATLAPFSALISPENAATRRWVPWLCAYTGARVNEMTQLTGRSIKQDDGIWIIDINPRDGDVKTQIYRKVPIHEHLIEQGFLDFVRSRGSGPLFYKAETGRRGSEANPTYVRMGQKLAEWVRTIGVDDCNVDPNHGWRHLFKTTARRVEMREDHMDAICGHAAASVGRKYGEFPVATLAAAITLLPRFVVEPAAAVDGRGKRQSRPSSPV